MSAPGYPKWAPSAVALTLWPEWAEAIDCLGKRVENRTWKLPDRYIGQRVYLHAGSDVSRRVRRERLAQVVEMAQRAGWRSGRVYVSAGYGEDMLIRDEERCAFGFGIRTSGLIGVMRFTGCDAPGEGSLIGWRAPDQYGWRFEYEPLAKPVGCSGALGFWTVPPHLEIP